MVIEAMFYTMKRALVTILFQETLATRNKTVIRNQ